ncbi:MAG: hypothetical protein PVS2B2_24590 [Candidatus Acidiferrum sp.]
MLGSDFSQEDLTTGSHENPEAEVIPGLISQRSKDREKAGSSGKEDALRSSGKSRLPPVIKEAEGGG